ncbi:hypothetical protein [Sulfuricella sp.]|uniref:hypothetical protein n=1 Tax=Sulfuricella sp. TaxID=2099377 RepID=UPI002C1A224C|nr:hypothetical protein [Sulfuricella sp.]HUX62223.1 hypothetical protein [Sulfuricella sp.]
MKVRDLIERLLCLHPDLEVMVPAKSNVDRVMSVYVARVAKTDCNYEIYGECLALLDELNTLVDGKKMTGAPFEAVIIDLSVSEQESPTRVAGSVKAHCLTNWFKWLKNKFSIRTSDER